MASSRGVSAGSCLGSRLGSRLLAAAGTSALAGWLALFVTSALAAADPPRIVINEILASNRDVPPQDIGGGFPDLLEIYNGSGETIALGGADDAKSYALSDSPLAEFDPIGSWYFPPGRSNILAGGFLVIFCDNNVIQGDCELHASFNIGSGGGEKITIWSPEDASGARHVVDRVQLPPLARNVSFGRLADGAGPSPVPLDETLDTFGYFLGPPGSEAAPTFGSCDSTSTLCVAGRRRNCRGAPNSSTTANLAPRVNRFTPDDKETENAPAANEPLTLWVKVRDDKVPTPGNIDGVELRYRVIQAGVAGDVQTVDMEYDDLAGVKNDAERGQPLDFWTEWSATIPGQPAGARVEFHFRVRDAEGLEDTTPSPLCDEGIGPCDREFGGPGCTRDLQDVTCQGTDPGSGEGAAGGGGAAVSGERYVACDAWFTYTVGYQVRAEIEGLVINEIVPHQTRILEDLTHRPCRPADLCPPEFPDCCKFTEDFIELFNGSGHEIDLSGLWLADRWFDPRGWQFPAGSKIDAGEHLVVWVDRDGGKCPDPARTDPPCFWKCPDPTDPVSGSYHTNFSLSSGGDQILLYDDEEHGFGRIHSVEFGFLLEEIIDRSLALVPDGDPSGCFVVSDEVGGAHPPSPGAANTGEPCPTTVTFRRGDANADCGVDISDGVSILNWLFLGASAPTCQDAADSDDSGTVDLTDAIRVFNFLFLGGVPPSDPGPSARGEDPSDDALPECVYNDECF